MRCTSDRKGETGRHADLEGRPPAGSPHTVAHVPHRRGRVEAPIATQQRDAVSDENPALPNRAASAGDTITRPEQLRNDVVQHAEPITGSSEDVEDVQRSGRTRRLPR